MRILKSITLAAMACICSMSVMAQENLSPAEAEVQELGYKPYPHGFIQLQGGVGTTFTNVPMTDLISPTASIGVGAYFTPVVGARLHFNAWESKGGFRSIPDTYKFNYLNTNADVLINLTNLFSKTNNHLFNVSLIGGIGLNYAWGNDDLDKILESKTPTEDTNNAWGDGKNRENPIMHNLRVGLLFDFNLSKHWNVGLEVDMNSLDDRFNSKYNNSDDWMMTAQLSLTYKFGHKKAPKIVPPVPVIVQEPEPAPVVEKKEVAPAPVVEEKKEVPLNETIYYVIRESETDRSDVLDKIAVWAKENKGKKVIVSAYADKQTGNPKINMEYAQKRADYVVKALTGKGVPAEQIEAKAYGDTVQPFADNDKNRCVIIVGK